MPLILVSDNIKQRLRLAGAGPCSKPRRQPHSRQHAAKRPKLAGAVHVHIHFDNAGPCPSPSPAPAFPAPSPGPARDPPPPPPVSTGPRSAPPPPMLPLAPMMRLVAFDDGLADLVSDVESLLASSPGGGSSARDPSLPHFGDPVASAPCGCRMAVATKSSVEEQAGSFCVRTSSSGGQREAAQSRPLERVNPAASAPLLHCCCVVFDSDREKGAAAIVANTRQEASVALCNWKVVERQAPWL